ncbi:hypothetical protein SNEBB_007771 [Seison nebaliae]|nr:hypothetical protein SNEBB_007771 [Seison nebaliae]
MLYLTFPTHVENKYYKLNGTFDEYLQSTNYRTFNQKVLEDLPWIQEICNEIINQYDYPNIVVFPLTSKFGLTYSLKLHPQVLNQLKVIITNIIQTVNANPLINKNQLDNIFQPIPYNELSLGNHRMELSNQYWNVNTFADQRLFRNFNGEVEGKNYKIYGVGLTTLSRAFEIISLTKLPKVAEDPKLNEMYNDNVIELYGAFDELNQLEGSDLTKQLIRNKAISIISNAVYYEFIATMEIHNIHKASSLNKTYESIINIQWVSKGEDHSLGVVKSFSDKEKWYFISNEFVNEITDVKKFFIQGYSFNYISDIFLHEEESYGVKNYLKQFIKPILLKDYERRID